MQSKVRPVRLLASVTNVSEARLALSEGADIIDAKNPLEGALGALPAAIVTDICRTMNGAAPVSATIGDLACEPEIVGEAVLRMAATGVDVVKIGLFDSGHCHETITHLGTLDVGRCDLVGVLLADQSPDFSLIPTMANAGFAGVLLDTADKNAGALPEIMSELSLRMFVALAHDFGLFAGLAGSLRLAHIAPLLTLGADVLGFRGALCAQNNRISGLDPIALRAVRAALPRFEDHDQGADIERENVRA